MRGSTGRQQLLAPLPRFAAPPLRAEQERARQLGRLHAVSYPARLPATAVLRISGFGYDELEDYQAFHRSGQPAGAAPPNRWGEASGGGEAGYSGGNISALELPETHLVLQFPPFQLRPACRRPQLGRGVRPDVAVVPTPRQVATHTDAVLPELPALLARQRP